MGLLFLFYTFLFSSTTLGQTATNKIPLIDKVDSLYSIENPSAAYIFYQNELNSDQAKEDSVYRAEIYHQLCQTAENLNQYTNAISFHLNWRNLHPFNNQAENQKYLDKVAQLLPIATDSLGLTRLYYRYALLLTREGSRDDALSYFLRALKYANALKNYAATATIANDLAGEYWDAGEKDLSNNMYQESVNAAKILNDSNRIAAAYLNLASNFIDQGDFKSGINIHLEALKMKELLTDKSNLSYYYQQTADVYHQASNYENWEKYITKAYEIRNNEDCTSPIEKATLYAALGGIAELKNQTEVAIQYYDTLLILSREIAYLNGQKNAYDNLALIYKNRGNYKKALELCTQSEAFLTDNPFEHISHNNTKAALLMQLGQNQEALALLHNNIKNKALVNYATERLRTFNLLYENNLQLNNYKVAIRWIDSLRGLENLLRDADVRKEMANLETKYQTEKKEQQIILLSAENEIKNQRMQQAWLLIGFLLVLVSLILFLLYFRRKKAAFKESELKQQLLRSQMNPHFIFNVMGSIQGFLYKNEATKAADYLSRFAALSRSFLNFSSQEKIRLKDEIEMLQNYIELERARMGSPFEIEYKIDENLETDFIEIPPMLLQPFVENAIKHGFQNIDYVAKLSLSFREKNGFIAVEILDNGRGLSNQKDKGHQSKALDIFYQRKKGIEHKFKKVITFDFQNLKDTDNSKQGVRVYIQLPILNDD